MSPSALRLIVLGQALIQHDPRAEPWLDFAAKAGVSSIRFPGRRGGALAPNTGVRREGDCSEIQTEILVAR